MNKRQRNKQSDKAKDVKGKRVRVVKINVKRKRVE